MSIYKERKARNMKRMKKKMQHEASRQLGIQASHIQDESIMTARWKKKTTHVQDSNIQKKDYEDLKKG